VRLKAGDRDGYRRSLLPMRGARLPSRMTSTLPRETLVSMDASSMTVFSDAFAQNRALSCSPLSLVYDGCRSALAFGTDSTTLPSRPICRQYGSDGTTYASRL
jgi:hypothetical protein